MIAQMLRNLWIARSIVRLVDFIGFCLSRVATRMSVELTEAEKALLPYMTNELYEKNHSVIATHFPIKQIVGRRLVDSGLLTVAEYVEISGLPENIVGSRLICSLRRKGKDSMETFYKVLVSARGERDVDVILRCLETAADMERPSKEVEVSGNRRIARYSISIVGNCHPKCRSIDINGRPFHSHLASYRMAMHKEIAAFQYSI